jgi:hypothetical protein
MGMINIKLSCKSLGSLTDGDRTELTIVDCAKGEYAKPLAHKLIKDTILTRTQWIG